MENRRMTTRSSRRASALPVSPSKQVMMANVTGVGKASVKRSSRKVLADKTNASPVMKLVPAKSPKKASVVADGAAPIEAVEEVVPPSFQLQSLELQPASPVVVRGEDSLRSLEHSDMANIQNLEGQALQSSEAEAPKFGVIHALTPVQEAIDEPEEIAAEVKAPTRPQQGEVVDARPPVEASPAREVDSASERLSSAWVGCDVHDVTEIGKDDSDSSVLVNVSSPGMQLVASPAPDATVRPTTPQSADFKWQWRDQMPLKLKEQGFCGFNLYGGDEEYEACDVFDGNEDYDGEVIDCEEICQAISRMGVADAGLPEHKGRHIRFNYNSDDEMEVVNVDVTRLRGVPTPRGKHLRFHEEQELPTA